MSTTTLADVKPPPLQGPTSKERKYDRQLRLWAANGQAALEDSNILLINTGAGVVGIETLKNLILPGVGKFTILDPSTVTEADIGVNFFLEDGDIGHSRAERCCQWLQELNPDVRGYHISQPIEQFLVSDNLTRNKYTLLIVILPLVPELVEAISGHSRSTGVPVFYVHSVGFYSHFTVQLPSAFPIVDTHPDPTSTTDLRLLEPWAELLEIEKELTHGLEEMDNEQHGHVPYLLLLLHYLEQWKSSHNGQPPQNYKEKTEFREVVRRGARTSNAEGAEENYDEAVAAVLKSLNPHTASSAVKEVFDSRECQQLTAESADFWVIAHAVSDFHKKNGVLPLSGSVPDMKAKSSVYIQLQNVYKSKARKDVAEVTARVRELEQELKRPKPADQKEIEAYCKSSGYVKLVRGIYPHVAKPRDVILWADRCEFVVASLSQPDTLILLYIAFLAYDSYCASHGMLDKVGRQHNGEPTENFDTEVSKMTGIAHNIIDNVIKEAETFIEDPEYSEIKDSAAKIVQELVRAGGGELHNIAAATGGMVAQEVIKVITKQYVPVDNTCLFDGITSRTSVLNL